MLLFGFAMILIWGVINPPPNGHHYLLGLTLSNFVGKTVYVTTLLAIMFLCGSVANSPRLRSWASFPETGSGRRPSSWARPWPRTGTRAVGRDADPSLIPPAHGAEQGHVFIRLCLRRGLVRELERVINRVIHVR